MIDSEAVLIKALEEYNTDRIFSLYILDKIKEELNKDKIAENFDFSKIVLEVTPLEGVILLFKFGSITGENYSDERIAKYLKISQETVIEKINHGMTLYKKLLKTKG